MTKSKYKIGQERLNTYADVLNDCQMPLYIPRPRANGDPNNLKMLSLFSGCGGMDIGFEGGFICNARSIPDNQGWVDRILENPNWVLLRKNRFCCVFANDILKEAQSTWLKYMRRYDVDNEIYHTESIVDLVKLARNGVNVFPEDIDIVTGGFPCQDFSIAGKREGFDSDVSHDGGKREANEPSEETRGKLYYWMKQVIDIVHPKIFIAENVQGLVSLGDVKDVIQHDFASADDNDYLVLPPQVLDAGNYGVPETRQRVIFIGIRKSSLNDEARTALMKKDIPAMYNPYPKPTHNHSAGNDQLLPPVLCREVLNGLPEPNYSLDLSQKYFSGAKYMGKHCQGQTEIDLDGLGPTIRSEHHGNIEYRRLSLEHGGTNIHELESGLRERRLTPRECALIQTFPPDYPFVTFKENSSIFNVSPSGAYKVIGNAVPPVLAYNIARRIQSLWNLYFD